MANPEHVEQFTKGVTSWNLWRKRNTDLRPDLENADLGLNYFYLGDGSLVDNAHVSAVKLPLATMYALPQANLRGAHLHEANLSGAHLHMLNLSEANLRKADLYKADLRWANLHGATLFGSDLSRADLRNVDLSGANLSGANLSEADLRNANLSEANLSKANLSKANLSETDFIKAYLSKANLNNANLSNADLSEANLSGADLSNAFLLGTILSGAYLNEANLSGTNLRKSSLNRAYLSGANLSGADLSGANLARATLVETDLTRATLKDCYVYGISVWNVQLDGTTQNNLIITSPDEPAITTDDLEVAQFIYLLLNHQKIRRVIDTITSQVVLILGCFPPDRRGVIDVLAKELRGHQYSPVIFNFEEAASKDFTATVRTLANMAHFVIIDFVNLNDFICEIADAIVPHCVVPIRPLLQGSREQEYEYFRALQYKHRWVLSPYRYNDLPELQSGFQEKMLQPIYERIIELKQKKPLKMFIGYAPEDEDMLNALKIHLKILERTGLIEVWDDQNVAPGEEKEKEIERRLSDARIILLLISPDFLNSHECYDIQMRRAIERHELGEARVIPIILRPCAWRLTPLQKFLPLPKDGKPISKHDKDEILFEVSEEIGDVIGILR